LEALACEDMYLMIVGELCACTKRAVAVAALLCLSFGITLETSQVVWRTRSYCRTGEELVRDSNRSGAERLALYFLNDRYGKGVTNLSKSSSICLLHTLALALVTDNVLDKSCCVLRTTFFFFFSPLHARDLYLKQMEA
jgi:hypothetical protein